MSLERKLRNFLTGTLIVGTSILGCGDKKRPTEPIGNPTKIEYAIEDARKKLNNYTNNPEFENKIHNALNSLNKRSKLASPGTLNFECGEKTGDLNNDNVINFDDFFLFMDNFGYIGKSNSDLNENDNVNFDDFFLFVDRFGYNVQVESCEEEITTEPIEVITNSETNETTTIYEASTNSQGEVAFIDTSSADGVAAIKVIDEETQEPVQDMQVFYEDHSNSKVFTAIDTREPPQLLPTRWIRPHNSSDIIPTASVRNGNVLTQIINDEEGAEAFYLWESHPGFPANPSTKWTYKETIDDSTRIEKDNINQAIITMIKVAELGVDPSISSQGVQFPISIGTLAETINPLDDREVKSQRWDVYERSSLITFAPERFMDIEIVPSNIPTIEEIGVEINGSNVSVNITASDKEFYELPFGLPAKEDVTIKLGPTEESDLIFSYTLEKEGEVESRGTTTENSIDFSNLAEGSYSLEVLVTDEVGNTSSDQTTFAIEEEVDLEREIAFTSDRDGNNEIYVMSANGDNVKRLTFNDGMDNYATWSPNGREIAFISVRNNVPDIYVMDKDGSDQTRLTNGNLFGADFTWSSDGNKIAFTSDRDGGSESEIYVMNKDGSDQTRLTNSPGDDSNPSWSPDGSKIVFESNRSRHKEIYIMNNDGSDQTRLTYHESWATYPSWSPDGNKIVYTEQPGQNEEIYVMDANGNNQVNLTNNFLSEVLPSWSPDGNKIAFVSYNDIYTMNSDGTNRIGITRDGAPKGSPIWSPDGNQIIYTSLLGDSEIVIIDSDGNNHKALTKNSSKDYNPHWSPF